MTTTTHNTSMQTVMLKVGLHCDGCERRVKKAIWHLQGITSVDVDDNRERITVTGFVDPARILKAVKKTGKPVELWKYQNGNKNLYGSQPLNSAPAKLSNASKGNKVQNSSNNNNNNNNHNHNNSKNNNSNNNKYPGFQHTNKLSDHKLTEDRSRNPQPDYFSDADSEFDSFPDTEFYGSDNKADLYTQVKPQKNQQNNFFGNFKSPKNQKNDPHSHNHSSDFKAPKNHQNHQKNDFYSDFKSPKNHQNHQNHQKNDVYSEFKSPKNHQNHQNHQKNDAYSEFKTPKNQKNDQYSDFKSPGNQQKPEFYEKNHGDFKPGKNQNSDYYGNHHQKPVKSRSDNLTEYSSHSHSFDDDENEFGRKPKSNQSGYEPGEKINQQQKSKANKSYENYNSSTHEEFRNSASSNNYGNQKFEYSDEEKPFNQKKPKSQLPAKYVSFEDEYEPSYHRPQQVHQVHQAHHQPVVNVRAPQDSRGHEQKFYTTYGHEQSYHPGFTYHESHRIPATNGFTNIFSEENPNACSIM